MKFICLLLLLSISHGGLLAQETTVAVNTDYLKKSKNQKKAAFILLRSGGALFVIGLMVGLDDIGGIFDPEDQENSELSDALIIGGVAVTAASIPFFISASKNKKKAASLSFKFERTPVIQQQSLGFRSYPAASLKIPIGKK